MMVVKYSKFHSKTYDMTLRYHTWSNSLSIFPP